jgi:hypothetical protein
MTCTRWLSILLAVSALCAWPGLAQAKPPEGITIKAEVGYNGWVQLGRVNPVIVDLENNSAATNLSGDLVLEYNGVEYVNKLDLPTPSKKRLFLYFPCDSYAPYLMLRVRTKDYTDQFDLGNAYKTITPEDLNIVVLTQQPGCLGAVNGQPAARLYRDLYSNQTSELGVAQIHVAYYNIDQIDPNPKFFSGADTIVLSDVDYQQVGPELASTLQACAAGGEGVVFSLGLNGTAVAASPLAQLCPLHATGTVQVPGLGRFGELYGLGAGTPATFAEGKLAPGAEVRAWAANYPAVVRQQWGSGYVTALAFDVTAVPFKQSPALAPIFADNALTLSDSVTVANWFIHPEQVEDILGRLNEAKPMSPGFVLLFLVCYIVLVGPVNFLILSKLRRHTLVWVTIPLIIAGFGYLGLSTGYLYRGSDNVCAYFQELHVFPHASYTPYQNVMLVFTAERTNYTLEVPDRSAFIYPDIPAVISGPQFGGGGANRLRGMSGGQVDDTDQPKITTTQGKWTQKTYFYQGYQDLAGSVDSSLRADRDRSQIENLNGSFTLDLPYDLYSCHLITQGNDLYLGDLNGKSVVDLSQLPQKPASALDVDADYLVSARNELTDLAKQAADLGLTYRDEALLIGFNTKLSALAEFKRAHQQYLLSMVVVHLPYQAVIPQTGKARIARWRLLGGKGFKLESRYWEQSTRPEMRQYMMERDGYLDVAYQIAGELEERTALSLLVGASKNNKNNNNYQIEPINNLSTCLKVGARLPDGRWQPLTVPDSDFTIYSPVAGLVDGNREVIVRYTARDEFLLEMPRPSM